MHLRDYSCGLSGIHSLAPGLSASRSICLRTFEIVRGGLAPDMRAHVGVCVGGRISRDHRERKRSRGCSEASVTAMHFTSFLIWRCFAVDAMPPREAPDIFRMFRVEGVYRAAALAGTACLLYAALVFLDLLRSAAASLLVREQHERVTLGCAH